MWQPLCLVRARRSPGQLLIALVVLVGCSIPLTVYAVSDMARTPHTTPANNVNAVQDRDRPAMRLASAQEP